MGRTRGPQATKGDRSPKAICGFNDAKWASSSTGASLVASEWWHESLNVKTLGDIRSQLASGAFEFSEHAFIRSVERNISEKEIREAGLTANVVEEYPDDKYGPSVLVFGITESGRPIHAQVSTTDTRLIRIITLYEPDPDEWLNATVRR